MKQIDQCLDRFFDNKRPLKTKWQALRDIEHKDLLLLYHYHHLILAYDLKAKHIIYQFSECPTDKRGLDAALKYLENKST